MDEFCVVYKVSAGQVYKAIKDGRIYAVMVSGHRRGWRIPDPGQAIVRRYLSLAVASNEYIIRPAEAAWILNVTRYEITALRLRGLLVPKKLSWGHLYRLEDILTYARRRDLKKKRQVHGPKAQICRNDPRPFILDWATREAHRLGYLRYQNPVVKKNRTRNADWPELLPSGD